MAERGFTLIELVCTIVILGSLASMALPRYADLAGEATRAAVATQAAAFASAVTLVRVAHLVSGRSGATDNVPGFGDGKVDTNANGYPTDTANANTIPNNNTGANRCRRVFLGILAGAPPICGGSVACTAAHYYRAMTAGAQTCRFLYVRDPTPQRFFIYTAQNGSVTVTNP